ncbi:MAG: PIN domain-containing protein [Nitrososphaeria archaeon]|nr:PIN domain-containing protein [Nitrososphaeria archaeon]
MECIVDTNILVYETVEDSLYHREVVERLEDITKIWIPVNILVEFALVLKKLGLDENFVCNKIKELLRKGKIELINVRKSDFEKAIEIISNEKLSILRLNDKLILSSASRMRIPLYTYDKHLKSEATKFGVSII